MSDIEWLETPESAENPRSDPTPLPEQPAPADDPAGRAKLISAVGPLFLLAAAVLAVFAPLRNIYLVTVPAVTTSRSLGASPSRPSTQGVDGWGRYSGSASANIPAGAHDIRFGIVLLVIAVLLILAAGAFAAAHLPSSDGRSPTQAQEPTSRWAALSGPATSVAVLAVGGLVAVTTVILLNYQAIAGTVQVEITEAAAAGGGASTPTVDVGGCVWLTLAASVCALVGLLAAAVTRRSRASGATADRAEAADEPAPDDPDEDLLERS